MSQPATPLSVVVFFTAYRILSINKYCEELEFRRKVYDDGNEQKEREKIAEQPPPAICSFCK